MRLNKIRLTNESSERLKQLKGRTGLMPNVLCRLGLCLSLADHSVPDPKQYPEEDREFNRYTLLGEWDDFYVALLRQRLSEDGFADIDGAGDEYLADQFRAHLNRGIFTLSRFLRTVSDVTVLCSPRTCSMPVDPSK